MERAKLMLFTGNLIDGRQAKEWGLATDAVPAGELDAYVDRLAKRVAAVPKNQLMMTKMLVNQAFEAQINRNQTLATFFDGFARYSPEGAHFERRAATDGFHAAVKERDSLEGPVVPDGVSLPTFFFDEMPEGGKL